LLAHAGARVPSAGRGASRRLASATSVHMHDRHPRRLPVARRGTV